MLLNCRKATLLNHRIDGGKMSSAMHHCITIVVHDYPNDFLYNPYNQKENASELLISIIDKNLRHFFLFFYISI